MLISREFQCRWLCFMTEVVDGRATGYVEGFSWSIRP